MKLNFFKRLLDGNDPLSSKRFISLVALALLVLITIASMYGKVFPDSLIVGILALITASIGATLINNNKPDGTT